MVFNPLLSSSPGSPSGFQANLPDRSHPEIFASLSRHATTRVTRIYRAKLLENGAFFFFFEETPFLGGK